MRENLIGRKYGYLTVIGDAGRTKKYEHLWLCKCECGNTKITRGNRLKTGSCKSCGCYQKQQVAKANTRHGKSRTKLYKVWSTMIQRCENSNVQEYKNYGQLGISVCSEWHDFETFEKWSMLNGYTEGLTIDRINNQGNYNPRNCRWVSYTVQANNKQSNHLVTIGDETKTISEWCRVYHINDSTVRSRLSYGWDEVEAITTKVKKMEVLHENNSNSLR